MGQTLWTSANQRQIEDLIDYILRKTKSETKELIDYICKSVLVTTIGYFTIKYVYKNIDKLYLNF